MRGRLLSFLDLLAITVAVMVLILSIVPDQPFDTPPTDWYSFTMEIDARSVISSDGSDQTELLGLGFYLNIAGERLDLFNRGAGERALTCNSNGLELTCYFRGSSGEDIEGYFFIRDDLFLLKSDTSVSGSISGLKIGLPEVATLLRSENRFTHSYKGSLN